MNQKQAATYAAAIVEALTPDFEDLRDQVTADIIRNAVQNHATSPAAWFEAILDSSANWRLKPDSRHPGRVLLACYRFNESDADRDRVTRINTRLQEVAL